MRTAPSERLLKRLRAYGLPLPRGARLVRISPSQRALRADGWAWAALDEKGGELGIGSPHPMQTLLASHELETIRTGDSIAIEPKD